MDNSRPAQPTTPRERLLRDPLHGVAYIRLRGRHKPVSERRELVTKGRTDRCSTCGTIWPCEVGQALGIVDWLLVRA